MSTLPRVAPAPRQLVGASGRGEDKTILAGCLRRTRTALPKRRGVLVRSALVTADVFTLSLAFLAAEFLYGDGSTENAFGWGAELLLFVTTLPAWLVVAKLYGLYERDEDRTDHSTVDEIVGVFHLVSAGSWLLVVAIAVGFVSPSIPKMVVFGLSAIVLVPLGRATARALCRRRPQYLQNVLIVGAGRVGQSIARKLRHHPEYGLNVVALVDGSPCERRDGLDDIPLLTDPNRLPDHARRYRADRVIFAFSKAADPEMLALLRSLQDLDVRIDIVPRLYEVIGPSVDVHTVEGLPLIGLAKPRLSPSSRALKRAFDVVLAGAGLMVLALPFVVVAVLIKLDSRGPVFFRQTRMGSRGRTFRIFKFRTMVLDADDHKAEVAHLNTHARRGGDPRMFKIVDDPRVTRVGRLLRRFSIDELPQLINVVRGDMSLVGPRPLILDEDRWVDDWARLRLELKPGITGLWQVAGRSAIPFEEMVQLDYRYVRTWSLWNDCRLLFQTLPAILRGEGALA